MWSSLTVRRCKDKTRDDTIAPAGDKDSDTANNKLSRAATFCYDHNYKEQNTKRNWLRNLPKVRNKFFRRINVKDQRKVGGAGYKTYQLWSGKDWQC